MRALRLACRQVLRSYSVEKQASYNPYKNYNPYAPYSEQVAKFAQKPSSCETKRPEQKKEESKKSK
jgi:hypothetical protein